MWGLLRSIDVGLETLTCTPVHINPLLAGLLNLCGPDMSMP